MSPGQFLYTVEYSFTLEDEYGSVKSSKRDIEGVYLTKADANAAAGLSRDEHAEEDDIDVDEFVEREDEDGLVGYEYVVEEYEEDEGRVQTTSISVERYNVKSLDVERTIEGLRKIEMKKFKESVEGGSLTAELREQLLQESRDDIGLMNKLENEVKSELFYNKGLRDEVRA